MNLMLQDTTNPIEMGARLKFSPNELLLLEADINYTNLHLVGGEKVIVSYHLGKLQKRLEHFNYFVRVNRNMLVNLNYLVGIEDDFLNIGKLQIQMSRRRKELVMNRIKLVAEKHFC